MVATRSARKSSAANSPVPPSPTTPTPDANGRTNGHVEGTMTVKVPKSKTGRKRKSVLPQSSRGYAHVVDPLTILWLFISLVLVTWDTGYVFLRPHSMPGGRIHSPIWTPYALYGTVDYIYGWPAYNDGVGFTAAQAALNIVETSMYGYYLFKLLQCGAGTEWYKVWDIAYWNRKTVVQGDGMAKAVVICFASAVMTVSKTVLYWFNEYFSSYQNVGHNTWSRLILLWVIPNGAWLVLPTYMIYVMGAEIVSAVETAGGDVGVKDE